MLESQTKESQGEGSFRNRYLDGFYSLLPDIALRVPLAIFIEVFSFFFLKLYRQSLHDIKYFQNEITNLESRYLAIKLARRDTNPENIRTVISELMKTERNIVLKTGDMTLEGERMKSENEIASKAMDTIAKVADKIKL